MITLTVPGDVSILFGISNFVMAILAKSLTTGESFPLK